MPDHEAIHEFRDTAAGYHAIIAIHSTRRGPAIGGTRYRAYGSIDEARTDALRLSEAMSRKTALAGLDAGGGKSVIMAPPDLQSRDALLRAHGRAVHSLGGRYITAPDVGITPADLDVIALETPWVARHRVTGGVDGSDTARGTAAAIRGALRATGRPDYDGITVAIQGCGSVGAQLAALLGALGMRVVVCDVDGHRANQVAAATGASVIDPASFVSADVDVLAPCALGGVFDSASASLVRARVVAGAANNQLASDDIAEELRSRGVTFVPDIVASAGGVIAGFSDFTGDTREEVMMRIDGIEQTVIDLITVARTHDCSPSQAARERADALLGAP